ncbi:MAG: class I SAM-dependent RNA methyltransferase [Bauldia sp.]|nr:class I SAM-dependent RNA methyltransferase [Bauldia sp.]
MAEIVRARIERLAHKGDGVAVVDGRELFVPFTLPGEAVEIAVDGDTATLVRVVAASADRAVPACLHFTDCGGCVVQHLATPAYLEWKRLQVVEAFAQRGIDAAVEPTVAIAPGTRRRVTFAIVHEADGPVLGFSRRASHDVVAIAACPVAVPAIATRLGLLRALAGAVVPRGRSARMTVVAADNGLDVAIDADRPLGRAIRERLAGLSADPALARLSIDGEAVTMAWRPEIAIGKASLLPVPGGFLQASEEAEAAIAGLVAAGVGKTRGPVADLFCGIGTLSLRLAASAPVTAVDGDGGLLTALTESAKRAQGLKPIATRVRDLFRNPMAPAELKPFATVVFDPPRAGAKAQAEALAKSAVPRVVAVSCNPATLARDARILIDGGYRLERVTPVDQFLWSAHVEAVAVFSH